MKKGCFFVEPTIGKRIALLRRKVGYTQDELAEKLNVSPQAVSKWENDVSCPDIMLLSPLAELLGITVDELLNDRAKPETALVPEAERKSLDDMLFKVIVNSAQGDKVRVNLPMPLVRIGLEMGFKIPKWQTMNTSAMRSRGLTCIKSCLWWKKVSSVSWWRLKASPGTS